MGDWKSFESSASEKEVDFNHDWSGPLKQEEGPTRNFPRHWCVRLLDQMDPQSLYLIGDTSPSKRVSLKTDV